jgi:hypothetical protein
VIPVRSFRRVYGAHIALYWHSWEHLFVTAQGSAYGRFRRALDRGNVTEALSAASELPHVGLSEALELCLLLRDKAPDRYGRAALRWHGRLCRDVDVSLEEAQAVLAALVLWPARGSGTLPSPLLTFSAAAG